MSLVAYEYSDSENETSDTETNESEQNTGTVLILDTNEDEKAELFSNLPTPKYNSQISIEENDDEFLRKTAVKFESNVNKSKNTVKISVPSLSEFSETDLEDVPKKIFKPSNASSTTGLFAVLPPPKTVRAATTKFVPKSVAKKPLQTPKTIKPVNIHNQEEVDTNDDAKHETGSFFFTSIFDNVVSSSVSNETVYKQTTISVDSARVVKEADLKTNKYFSEMVKNTTVTKAEDDVSSSSSASENNLVSEAYSQLVGNSRKAKGKGKANKKQEMNIIDIDATDIMSDRREWMTKSLTEEQPTVAVKKGEEPSMQQRRKHQITYLAYQAKVNEQDLKNQWAMNRVSRKQTQAKYGF